MKKIISIAILAMLMATLMVGCTQNGAITETSSKNTKNKINIVTTIFPIYDFTRAIIGDKANLSMLVAAGTSIHSYDPSPTDIIKIQKADVFICIGGESDKWVDRVLGSMDISKKKVIKLMEFVNVVEEETVEGMESEKTKGDAKEEIGYDEHIWTSTKNAVKMINAISNTLCTIDSENTEIYKSNAKAYVFDIEKVHTEIQSIVDNSRVKMIVMGDKFPFRYFADEFGLEYRAAFNGCSTETEASASTIAYLIDTVKKNNISTVFYIELSNKNVASAISEHTGAKMLELNSCQSITKADFEKGITYVSIMRQNAGNLKMGLE